MIELALALLLSQAKAPPPAAQCITAEASEQQLRTNGLPTESTILRGAEAQALTDRLSQQYSQPHIDADEVRLYHVGDSVIVMVFHGGCRIAGGIVHAQDIGQGT